MSKILTRSKELLGSVIQIKLLESDSKFFSFSFDEIKRIEEKFSRFLDSSELSKLNSNLNKWQEASNEYIFLLRSALEFYNKTKGNFDVTLKSSLDNLGYNKDYTFVFKKNKESFLEKVKSKFLDDIKIDKNNIFLRKEVDFGGLGKGYAVDKIKEILDKSKVENYFINAGGDIYAKGKGHKIILEHPSDSEKAIGTVVLDKKAIACSSPFKRKWKENHHLLNAKTKKPENSVKTIFVLANTCMEADAYATALFTAGFEEAIDIYKILSIELFIVSDKNKMFISPGFNIELFD